MGGNDGEGGANSDVMQRLQSSFATSSSSLPKQQQITLNQLDIPQVNNSQFRNQIRQLSPNVESNKRVGIPPSHPQMPPISPYSGLSAHRTTNQQLGLPNFVSPNVGPVSHSRSLSQPLFFSNDSLPPLGSFQYRDSPNSISEFISNDVSMEDRDGNGNNNSHTLLPYMMCNNSLPPRKAHRRSNSDIPFGFSSFTPSLPPQGNPLIKRETSWENNAEGSGERKSEGEEIVDDLFSAYMNLDNIEPLNSSENLSRDDMDSRASGTKTNGGDSSDNEASSSVNDNTIPRSAKRNAGEDITPTTRHYRSVSMDSFMDKINFEEESAKLPPINSIDGNSNPFSLEFGNGEFSGADLKKIMSNEKLAEIALSDPKKAKRILANRQSAARSKERKTRYIVELEHKVQTLQTEATTLSAQLTLLQRDSTGLSNQNNELKFRLQAMEQQAHLRDALNEALTGEVHRLKLATAELSGGDHSKFQQLSINSQMFQMHHQVAQLNHHYMQQKQSQPQAQAQAQAQAQVNGNSTQTNDSIK